MRRVIFSKTHFMGFVPVRKKDLKLSLLELKTNCKSQQDLLRGSSTLNKKLKPIIRYEGGRKFFFPEKQRQILMKRFNSSVK